MCQKVQGALYPAVRPRDISSFCLPPFSLSSQRRIVAEIEKQFTRLEAGVAALRRVQANLKRYRAAVLKAACEGKLVPTEHELSKSKGRRKKDETKRMKPADSTSSFLIPPSTFESGEALLRRILTERRQNWQGRGQYKEPVGSAAANLPQIPEGWACASLGEVCYRITDGTHLKPTYMEKGMPFLSVKNVRPFRIYDTDIKYISAEQHAGYVKRCRPEKGDILYTKVGATYGYAAINTLDYDFSIYVSLALLKYPQHLIEPKYIEMCMNSPVIYFQAQKRIKGIGRPDLHLEEISGFLFSAPPAGRADADRGGSGAAVERGGGVGVGGDRQPATSGAFEAINPAKSIHRRIGMKPPFIILHSSFYLGNPSILQKAFTGELTN